MATKYFFADQSISIPGAYSTIKSGIKNSSLALAFGNTLIIDTGSGKFFGGGSGVNGVLKNGKESLFTFNNDRDFRKFVRGGLHWLLAGPLFLPGAGAPGVSSLTYIRAATTVPAQMSFSFGLGDLQTSDDGNVVVKVNDEGYVGNGVMGDETRPKSTITISAAGTTGNSITVSFNGEACGSYTNLASDSIATVVAGLAAAITANGYLEVFSTSPTTIVVYGPRGSGADNNTLSLTFVKTGTANCSATAFAGGVEGVLLTRGYAAKMSAGVRDTTKHIMTFYRGNFKGLDGAICADNAPFDDVAELSTKPETLVSSPEIGTVTELVNWMKTDFNFNSYFTLASYSIAAVDNIGNFDRTFYSTYKKASGGTETFGTNDLSSVLDAIADLNFDFVLADKWGDNATATSNQTILSWITNNAPIKPDMYVGGGIDVSKWNSGATSSISIAVSFNSQYVTLVHGGGKKIGTGGLLFKEYDSIYKAAVALGREAGLEPQIPMAFKAIGISGESHMLNKKDIELGLDKGVLMTHLDGSTFDVVKGINTLQNNSYLINPDGSTPSKQFARIERQLNKELTVNAKNILLKSSSGANRNTVSTAVVKSFVEEYLKSKCSTNQKDNILISFQQVEVNRVQDAYEVTYAFEPNTEVSFLFFTGFAIDPATI